MTPEDEKARVRRYVQEAWNNRDLSIIDELMAPSYRRYPASGGTPLDREGQKQRIAGFHRAFPDLRMSIDRIVAEGDQVAFRLVAEGTHQGAFLGVEPTGKHVTFTATDIVRFEGDHIAEHWGNSDDLGLLRQIQSQ